MQSGAADSRTMNAFVPDGVLAAERRVLARPRRATVRFRCVRLRLMARQDSDVLHGTATPETTRSRRFESRIGRQIAGRSPMAVGSGLLRNAGYVHGDVSNLLLLTTAARALPRGQHAEHGCRWENKSVWCNTLDAARLTTTVATGAHRISPPAARSTPVTSTSSDAYHRSLLPRRGDESQAHPRPRKWSPAFRLEAPAPASGLASHGPLSRITDLPDHDA